MATLGERFPRWRAVSQFPINWDIECDFCDERTFRSVHRLIINTQAKLSCNLPQIFWDTCDAMANDIVALQQLGNLRDSQTSLRYLQFETSILPLKVAMSSGQRGRAYNWIHNGTDRTISAAPQRAFEVCRIALFLEIETEWIRELRTDSLLEWFPLVFGYARSAAAITEVAAGLIPLAIGLIDQVPITLRGAVESCR